MLWFNNTKISIQLMVNIKMRYITIQMYLKLFIVLGMRRLKSIQSNSHIRGELLYFYRIVNA